MSCCRMESKEQAIDEKELFRADRTCGSELSPRGAPLRELLAEQGGGRNDRALVAGKCSGSKAFRASLLGARTLLGAPGRTTRSKGRY